MVAVVGHGVDNAKSGAAVGAVGKRVAVAAVVGVVDFSKTGWAGGGIGWHGGVHGCLVITGEDLKVITMEELGVLAVDGFP